MQTVTTQQRTLSDLFDAYTRDYLPQKHPSTQYHNRLLYQWMAKDLGAIPLEHLTPLVLRTWFDGLTPHYKPASIRRFHGALGAVLTAGVIQYEWLRSNPMRRVPKPPATPFRERCLEAHELRRLLDACQQSKNPHLAPFVRLALLTGCRKNELLQRRWSEVDLERGILSIPQSKNGQRRAIPLVPDAVALLRQHHARVGSSPWCFPQRDGTRPCFIDYAWTKACQRAGLADLHIHDLRHCTASFLAMSGAQLRDIAAILGHKDLQMSMRYAHLTDSHMHDVVQRMAEAFLGAEPAPAPDATPTAAPTPGDAIREAEAIIAQAQAAAPGTPALSLEIQCLEAVRALEPLPASSIQIANVVDLPVKRVRDILQAWAQRGTLRRISKGYYRYQKGDAHA
jgi:integrase